MSSDKKFKIIHTEASPHWGGQEIRIFEEMKWFREQGHEMLLVAPDNGTLLQAMQRSGVPSNFSCFHQTKNISEYSKKCCG